MSKYLFGSKMLKLNNCRDEDWLTFVDEDTKTAREMRCMSIPFYQTIINHFIRGKNIKSNPFNALYLFQLSAPFIEAEDYPFADFNIFDHKGVWVEWLKAYMNAPEIEQYAFSLGTLHKTFYHILYQYHMIVEDTHWISDEAKASVQKIHDYKMPSSYFYELREKINSL